LSGQSVAEIVKRVRRIQIVANRMVDDLFAGEYHSAFRGRGMEFDEVREYQPGDDVRTIDWNVTARQGAPFVKRFREERELTVLFLVDVSASGAFGTASRSKLDVTIEIAALLMFSALKNNDKVGLALFCDDILRYLPPRKGKANVLRFLRELVAAEPVARETCIDRALDSNRRHDVVAITISDPREHDLPDVGFVTLRDAESGEVIELDTRHKAVRALFGRSARAREEALNENLRRCGVDRLAIRTDVPYTTSLHRFFRGREKRAAR